MMVDPVCGACVHVLKWSRVCVYVCMRVIGVGGCVGISKEVYMYQV